MIDFLLEPMAYDFMWRALVVVVAASLAGALLSCWLVHMGWALMGDAVSHAVLPGVAVASMIGMPFAIGAFLAALIAVALIGAVRESGTVREDAAMGIVFTALFSVGLVLIARFPSQQDLHTILFGSLLGVGDQQLVQVVIVAAFTVVVLLAFRRDLVLLAFDKLHAHTLGLRTKMLTGILLVTLATATVAGVQSVGVILVVATLIIPGATAQLLTNTMRSLMMVSVIVALVGGVAGVYIGYYADLPPGPVVVIAQATLFTAAQLFAPHRGIVTRAVSNLVSRRSETLAA
ncbi:metal ABC transporter permease [Dietzia aurantiaca]|uniref:metal ABC transporter permease n=1 Tax=Dietzia aurantiaca TaxID=983873 RepID=UPI001E33C9EA|nr:metal ABC transporter permease [Dietzia aurantiaca]MCD2263093.1 metal ABC transporter permease [Dietzia aurantiaca]